MRKVKKALWFIRIPAFVPQPRDYGVASEKSEDSEQNTRVFGGGAGHCTRGACAPQICG